MTYLPPDQKFTESLFDLVTNQGIVCKQLNGYYLQMELTEGHRGYYFNHIALAVIDSSKKAL